MSKVRHNGVVKFVRKGDESSPGDESRSIIVFVGEGDEAPPRVESNCVVGDGDEAPPEGVQDFDVGNGGPDVRNGGESSPVVAVSESVAGDKGQTPRSKKEKRRAEEVDPEDDCAVYGNEDCDDVDDAVGGGDNDDNEVHGGLCVEEDVNLNIEDDFPKVVRAEEAGSDCDSGDDIFDEDKIPDPLSSDDEDELEEEDKDKEEGDGRDVNDPDSFLAIEKTYNSPEDFKLAVLMYSLKTRYDIKLYRSQSMVVAAKCCYVDDDGVKFPWREYCAYVKRKHKLQIKVYVNEHICVRSGYSKMLKRSSIAFLFEERLRLNPKLTKYDMVAEIKREYNLEVTPDQCAKAKTKVMSARKVSHESHFARIWDYQAEVLKQNKDSEFEIETVQGQ